MVDALSDIVKSGVSAFQLGSGTTVSSASGVVDFGAVTGKNDVATVTVSASWVTPNSLIICSPFAVATSDHDPEDYAVENILAYAANRVNGVSFDIIARAPNTTWGKYVIHAVGV